MAAFAESAPRAGCLLDRDGVIVDEVEYLSRVDELRLIPGSAAAIVRLNRARIPVVVVTNQSAVARGMLTEQGLAEIHAALDRMLAAEGAHIDRYEYCPHHPIEGVGAHAIECDCRKPAPGMLLRAAAALDLDLGRSMLVGDKLSDVAAGAAVGCRTCLVRTGHGASLDDESVRDARPAPDLVVDDLAAAVDHWLAGRRSAP